MKPRHDNRRFDDTEIRSKMTLLNELHICQFELEMQNSELSNTKQQLAETLDHELLRGNRRLMQNLFNIQDEERRQLARELHDELGQWLTAMNAEAETIANHAKKDSTIYASAQAISECIKKTHEVIHAMLHQLRPALLDTLGIIDALLEMNKHWCSHHTDISLDFKLKGQLEKLGEPINTTIYRIIQEALNNISSHAKATQAQVCLSREPGVISKDDFLSLRIEDNGKGFDLDQASNGLGLLGMRERTIAAGGEFTIHSIPNDGTQIHVRLPLNILNKNKRRRADDR
jgi:signal transduction histidine kinase